MEPGRYRLGPDTGTLQVLTRREGAAAAVGHDLTLTAADWSAQLELTLDGWEATRLSATVALASLEVTAASGGIKPLSDRDRADIAATMRKLLCPRGPEGAAYTADTVTVGGDGVSATVVGALVLHEHSTPVQLAVTEVEPGHVHCVAMVRQTAFGITPYRALLGALRLHDEVIIDVDGTLTPVP